MNRPERIAQQLYCRSFGTGPRQVLALHCTMAHSGAWRGLAEVMDGEVTIHATDMLNHGKSPDWDGKGDFQQCVLEGAAAHLSGRMDVIGHSFGATVALRMAVEFPELVRSVTLIEPVYFAFVKDSHPEKLAEEQAGSAAFYAALEEGDPLRAARLFNAGWGNEGGPSFDQLPEASQLSMARGVQIVPACAPAIIGDCHEILRPGVLDRVAMPALLIRGSATAPIIGLTNDAIAARLPDARNVVVEGAGHMVPLTHPTAVAGLLRELFARAPAG